MNDTPLPPLPPLPRTKFRDIFHCGCYLGDMYSADQLRAYAAAAVAAAVPPSAALAEPVQPVAWALTYRGAITQHFHNRDTAEAELTRMQASYPNDAADRALIALYAAPPQPREPMRLTDEQMLECVRSVGTPAPMGLTRDSGPYEVTEPTWFLTQLVRAVEDAVLRAQGIEP